jgi:hypothetical protein
VHRIAVHRAWAAWSQAILGLTWLLVLAVVMASVDRLPDPPAARRDYTQFKISNSHEQPASLGAALPLLAALIQPPLEHVTSLPSAPVSHSSRALLLWRASDSSPPVPHRYLQLKAI